MIYRDAEEALRRRREELRQDRLRELEELPVAATAVYWRRWGRSVAGMVGICIAIAIAVAAAFRAQGLTYLLWAAWPAMAVAYGAAAIVAQYSLRWRLTGAFTVDGEALEEDVARLEAQTPASLLRDYCAELAVPSLSRPMIALSLLTPLSLHSLAAAALKARVDMDAFDNWISVSLVVVGHCHLILAYHARRFAVTAVRTENPTASAALALPAAWRAWGAVVAWSLLASPLAWIVAGTSGERTLGPFVGLGVLIIAPAIVAATATVFVPGMFKAFGGRLLRERQELRDPAPQSAS